MVVAIPFQAMLAVWEEGRSITRGSKFPKEDRNLGIFKSKIPQLLNVKMKSNTTATKKVLCGPIKTCLWVGTGWIVNSSLARC